MTSWDVGATVMSLIMGAVGMPRTEGGLELARDADEMVDSTSLGVLPRLRGFMSRSIPGADAVSILVAAAGVYHVGHNYLTSIRTRAQKSSSILFRIDKVRDARPTPLL